VSDLAAALAVMHAAADEAGAVALAGLGRARDIQRKAGPSDLVTEFDLASERAIVGRLRAAFPSDAIIAEESGADADGGVQRRWYVDPIDGTTNFAHGLPFFCVSIALHDEAGPALGLVEAPALGWRFVAVRGQGATLEERARGLAPRPLHTSATPRLEAALLATGFPYDLRSSDEDNLREFSALQRDAQAVRRVGSAALDLSMVAAGWLDAYWEQKLKPWDLAAGVLLVTEAGGRITGYDGETLDRSVFAAGRIIASNGHIHEELAARLAVARAALKS
jgi:myo-inositol-1(or 4)-monophosphatase